MPEMATSIPAPGISVTLAADRAARLRHLRYALTFDIPRNPGAPVRAEAGVTFTLQDAGRPLVLDFARPTSALHRCTVNGVDTIPALLNGHIVVTADVLRPGANALWFEFEAGDAPMNRREDYAYTILVPARAHELFPCFDQPDLKAAFSLTLAIPHNWEAVANAPERERLLEPGPGADRCLVSFVDTDPLPTYLFAFAAGRFSVETAFRAGRMIRLFHHEADDSLIARNRRTIVDQHVAALSWLENYTSIPYPFTKFDIVLLPAFQFSGMEHPGAIFYNATSLLLDGSATRQQELGRANLIAHETAHIWFGDLVTMRWFGDVWMKEVFANFMAAKIVNPAFPDLNHDLRFLHAHYPGAYDVDRTAGTHPIRQRLDNLSDAGSLYGAIIYLKSPIVMRQLELLVGADTLRDALRDYLRRYAFSNADWPDLIALLAGRASAAADAWSHDWVDVAGRPSISVELDTNAGTIQRLALRSSRDAGVGSPRWPQRLAIALGYGAHVEHVPCEWYGDTDVPAARGRRTPDYVLPNGGGLGYGEFHLDTASLTWLVRHLPIIGDPLTRGCAWLTLWDAMLNGSVSPPALAALGVSALPHETEELNTQRILGYLERLFWIFLTPVERAACAAGIESAVRTRLVDAAAPTLKSACFAAYRALATTTSAVAWLEAVWRGDAPIEGLTLGDGDYIALAQELAVRGVPGCDSLLRFQTERTAHADRRDALLFVMPALSTDEAERERFFLSLSDVSNRRREPWVVDGLRWLHHPLRQASARRFIEPGLDLLEEVKRTGDIFLPKRWVDATLGGHSSAAAAGIVRQFVDSRPASYPLALTRIVLASADYLFRSAHRT